MRESKQKSRTFRRVQRKTPGGRTVTHYERRMPQKPHCGGCGIVLSGVARGNASTIKKIAKTARRPERPYGGVLCSRCSRSLIKKQAQL